MIWSRFFAYPANAGHDYGTIERTVFGSWSLTAPTGRRSSTIRAGERGPMNLKECRLLVTPTSYGKNDSRLKTDLEAEVAVTYNPTGKPLTSSEVATCCPGSTATSPDWMPSTRPPLRALTGSRSSPAMASAWTTWTWRLQARKIIVTNTPGANSVSVAELALGLMLALARQIPEAVEAVHQGKWPRYAGLSLEGKTIGILGLGAIGKQLVRRLAGFDCRILAYDPLVDAPRASAVSRWLAWKRSWPRPIS